MRRLILNVVRDLLSSGNFLAVSKTGLPEGAYSLTSRYVLAIKSLEDGKINCKVKYAIVGHIDGPLCSKFSSIVSSIAPRLGVCKKLWSSDIKLTNLQSTNPLIWLVFTKNRVPDFRLEPGWVFRIIETFVRSEWCRRSEGHENTQTTYKRLCHGTNEDRTVAIILISPQQIHRIDGTYVDKLLRAGTND